METLGIKGGGGLWFCSPYTHLLPSMTSIGGKSMRRIKFKWRHQQKVKWQKRKLFVPGFAGISFIQCYCFRPTPLLLMF